MKYFALLAVLLASANASNPRSNRQNSDDTNAQNPRNIHLTNDESIFANLRNVRPITDENIPANATVDTAFDLVFPRTERNYMSM